MASTDGADMEQPTDPNLPLSRQPQFWAAGAAFFVLQAAALIPATKAYLSLQDEGNLLAWASRMLSGQVPYRDFFCRFMPGTPKCLELLFRIWGEQIWVVRLYFVVSVSLLVVGIWWLSCRLMPKRWAALPPLLFIAVGAQVWPMLGYHWDSSLPAIGALLLVCGSQRRARLILGGVLAGVTVLFLQPRGVAVCFTLGLLALARPPRWQRLAWVIAGAAAPGLVYVGWLLAHGAFGLFWEQAVAYNVSSYSVIQRYPFEWTQAWNHLQVVGTGLGSFGQTELQVWSTWLVKVLAYTIVEGSKYSGMIPVLLAAGVLVWRTVPKESELLLGCLSVCLVSLFLGWSRATPYHLNFFTPFWYPVLTWLLWRASRPSPIRPLRPLALGLTGILIFGFGVQGVENVRSWSAFRFPVPFPRGTLYCDRPDFAQETRMLTERLAQVGADGPIFGFPEVPMVIWLSGHVNAGPYESLLPLFFEQRRFEEVRTLLVEQALSAVLFRSAVGSIPGNYPAVPLARYAQEEERTLKLLTQGARGPESFGGFELYLLP